MTRFPSISLALSSAALALTAALLPGCDDSSSNSCDEYVDYMCDCHSAEYDCQDLRNTYADPDSELQDECALSLEDQEDQDAEDGAVCGDTGTAR